jgi:hypothetical protein
VISSTTPGKLTEVRYPRWILRKEVARFDGMSDDATATNPARLAAVAGRLAISGASRPEHARLSFDTQAWSVQGAHDLDPGDLHGWVIASGRRRETSGIRADAIFRTPHVSLRVRLTRFRHP